MINCILLIGAGAIAHHHATAARKLSHVPKLIAADPNESARARFLEAFPEAEVLATPEALLALPREGVEVVIVATPPFLHYPQALAALRSGRHVLVEKPLALEVGQAESLFAEAQSRGLELACCSSRFSSRVVTAEIRRRLLAGDIGDGWRVRWQVRSSGGVPGIDYQPESRWFLDRSKAGGGTLFDWGCYDVALWNEIFQPEQVTVDAGWFGYPRRGTPAPSDLVFDVEHQVTSHLRLHCSNGRTVPVLFERANTCYGGDLNITQIEGSRGALEWDWIDTGADKIRWFHERAPGECVMDEAEAPADPAGIGIHDRPLHQLDKKLSGHAVSDVSGSQALFNFRVINAIGQVAQTGQAVTITH